MSCTSTYKSHQNTFDLINPLSLPYWHGNAAKSLLPEIVLGGPLLLQGVCVCVSVGVLIGHNDNAALLHSVCLSLLYGRRDR